MADNDIVFQSLPHQFEYNFIRSIFRDSKGYMWIGTGEGLVKFDGINTTVYESSPNNPKSLSNNSINSITEDTNHNLWIGTSEGLDIYNRKEDNFIHIEKGPPNNFSYITSVCFDQDSLLWLGTYVGVFSYNIYTHEVHNYTFAQNDPNSLSMDHVNAIGIDRDKRVWIATQHGLNLFLGEKKGFRRIYLGGGAQSAMSNFLTCLAVDLSGFVWVGSIGGGVFRVAEENDDIIIKNYTYKRGINSISSNFILSLCADKRGFLWIGTDNGGLNRLNFKTGVIDVFQVEEGNENSLKSNSIWTLYVDDEERLWIGTYNKGVHVVDPNFRKFEVFQKNIYKNNSLTDNDVTGFAEASDGNIWICTDGGGICKFDPNKKQIIASIYNSDNKKYLSNNAVQSIFTTPDNDLWLGLWAGGLDRLNSRGKFIRNYSLSRPERPGSNNSMGHCMDKAGNLWVGSAGAGLFKYDVNQDKLIPVYPKNESQVITTTAYVTSIWEDFYGTLWIGTLYGLAIFNDDYSCFDIFHSTDSNSLSSNMVEYIFEDSKHRLWVGTTDRGLNLLNRSDTSFTFFDVTDGLPGNSIKSIVEDERGNLWIGTNKGISRFNLEKKEFTNYSMEDGLNSNEFYFRSSLKIKDGRIFFGNENGFVVFHPDSIRKNINIPPVYLTDFKINNRSLVIGDKNSPLKNHISETAEILLNHKQSSFTIEFVALNYTRSTGNQFSYMLDGFDEEWNNVGTKRSATYTNIKPGKYTFLVKGSNNDGLWNEVPTQLKITIKQPYWKSWWARIIYLLIFYLLVFILIRIRNERINMMAKLRLEHLAREKEHELHEANIQFFTNISHEFRTPLSLIIAPLENLILSTKSKAKEQLSMIYKNAKKLLQLTNNLMDFRKLEEGMTKLKVRQDDLSAHVKHVSTFFEDNLVRRGINFSLSMPESPVEAWFDSDMVETVIINLMSNAYKYTPDYGKISLTLKVLSTATIAEKYQNLKEKFSDNIRFAEIEVSDNGIGISSDELPLIFDKFYRSKTIDGRQKPGTGIGLTLARGYVELHHGSIVAESTPGTNTCFSFIIPIDKEAYYESELVKQLSDSNLEKYVSDIDTFVMVEEEELISSADPDDESIEILIVEDNADLRKYLAFELGKKYTVIQAENGRQGIDFALSDIPDLIVSDILMPDSNGIELCSRIKTDVRTCHIPVILLSAKTSINEQIEGIKSGADAYITKPFSIQYLLAMISQLINLRKKLYAQFSQDVYMIPDKLSDNTLDQEFLKRIIEYIVNNIADSSLSVDNLSIELNLSRSTVYRKIKALTGQTIIEFIRIIRLKQAIKLMETKKFTISEIAYQTGFTSPSYFTKIFREQYGNPPTKYLSE